MLRKGGFIVGILLLVSCGGDKPALVLPPDPSPEAGVTLAVTDFPRNLLVTFTDLQGTGWTKYTGTGSRCTVDFVNPWMMATDSQGRIYVADSGNHRVVRVDDITGKNCVAFGTEGAGNGQLTLPNAVAIGPTDGKIYITEASGRGVIRIDDMTGAGFVSFGTPGSGTPSQFKNPKGVALDSQGKIYINDSENYRIVRIDDMNGTNLVAYQATAGNGVDQFEARGAVGLHIDRSGADRIYLCDEYNNRLVRLDSVTGGTNFTTLGGPAAGSGERQFNLPHFVTQSPSGKFYVVDTGNSRVVRMDDFTGTNWFALAFPANYEDFDFGVFGPVGLEAPKGIVVFTTP